MDMVWWFLRWNSEWMETIGWLRCIWFSITIHWLCARKHLHRNAHSSYGVGTNARQVQLFGWFGVGGCLDAGLDQLLGRNKMAINKLVCVYLTKLDEQNKLQLLSRLLCIAPNVGVALYRCEMHSFQPLRKSLQHATQTCTAYARRKGRVTHGRAHFDNMNDHKSACRKQICA